MLLANLSPDPIETNVPDGRTIWMERKVAPGRLEPWTVLWSIQDEGGAE